VHDVPGVAPQVRALVQRLAHQAQLAVLKIANAAVHELGRAARGGFGKVGRLDERRLITPSDRIERGSEPRRAAADDEHVEVVVQLLTNASRFMHRGT
jgi:hypothetical protein